MGSLKLLIGAAVPPDPNTGAAGTVFQMNAAMRQMGLEVDEIWQQDLRQRIRHGNLHYLLELPRAYRREVRARCKTRQYDVIELNQPHAYLAALDHQRSRRPGVFVNRSHGHEVRVHEVLGRWRRALRVPEQKGPVRAACSAVLRRLLHRQWDVIARAADGFVVSCREDAEFLQTRYGVAPERIGTITQGVSEEYLRREPPPFTPERQRRLLYVGQYAFFKGPTILARAAAEVLKARPEASLTWICHEQHHHEVRGLFAPELQGRVSLKGWMPQEELIAAYDSHGVFAFPSLTEGFGKTPLEAMSRGTCVVATATGGMRDYIADGENGFLVHVGDAPQLAAAVLRLMDDLETCVRVSGRARATACQHTWTRCAADAVRFYEELLKRKSCAGSAS